MTAEFILSTRQRVLDYVRQTGIAGATGGEIEQALKMMHRSVAGRIGELKLQGHIKDSGTKRLSGKTGKPVIVWIISDGVPIKPQKPLRATQTTTSFYVAVRSLAIEYLKQRLPELYGSQEFEEHISRVSAEVDSVLREASARIAVLDRKTYTDNSRKTSAAWRTLGMRAPKRGTETAALWKARSLKKKLARELHPDRNSGEGAATQLDEVIKAYTLLESVYGQAVKPTTEPRTGRFGS